MYGNKKKDFPIYSSFIAAHLLLNGFKMYGVAKNTKYNDKTVFYFKDCQEVRNAVEEIKRNRPVNK